MATIQENFRAAVKRAEELSATGLSKPEDRDAYKSALTEAQALKATIEDQQAMDALKTWGKESAGSVVKAGWSGEAIMESPDGTPEGDIPGVSIDKRGLMYDISSIGAKKLKVLKSGLYKDAWVEYLRASAQRREVKGNYMKVLMEGQDDAGGYWVPPDLRPEIVQKIATVTGVADNVWSFTTSRDVASFPAVIYTTDNKATTGISLSWTAEAPSSDISETTNPAAGRINIPVHTATVALIVTRAMLEDAPFDILGFLSAKIGEAYKLGINDAYINGTGIGKPQGILTHSNATVAHSFTTGAGGMYVPSGIDGKPSWEGSTVGTQETGEGLVAVESALPPQYEAGAKWYMAKNTKSAIGGLMDTAGRPLWLRDNQFANYMNGTRNPPMLLGYPVVTDQYVPALATGGASYPVIFGDLAGYYAPQRVGMSVEVLRELRALKDEYVIYARMRVGGQLVEDYRLKTMKAYTS